MRIGGMMNILERFKDGLSPEDFKSLEESILTLIEEKADAKAKELAEIMVESETSRIETLAEAYVEQKTEEIRKEAEAAAQLRIDSEVKNHCEIFEAETSAKLAELSEELINKKVAEIEMTLKEEYDAKVVELEESIVDRLDRFLDAEITSKISDEVLMSVAINETYSPIIEGIRDLFEDRYVALDASGRKHIEEANKTIAALESKLNESVEDKMELYVEIDGLKKETLLLKKIENLTESNKTRVRELFEDKNFEETSKKIDGFIDLIKEKELAEETSSLYESEERSEIESDAALDLPELTENTFANSEEEEEEDEKETLSETLDFLLGHR